jgi:hypothetical protein
VQWIKIAVYNNENFAQIAKEILEKNDIPVLLKKDALSSAYGIGGTIIGGAFYILTTEMYLEKAVELLKVLGEEFIIR